MGLLTFDKPKQLRPAAEHNEEYQSDSGIAGTYIPNMSREDKLRWKAKLIKSKTDPRVEIRKTLVSQGVQVLVVVRYKGPGQHVTLSANGKMSWDGEEGCYWYDLNRAVNEAYNLLVEGRYRSPE